MKKLRESVRKLIAETSANLPGDVRRALASAIKAEPAGGASEFAMRVIATNVDRACTKCQPICQDTGTPTFEIDAPAEISQVEVCREIEAAVVEATRTGTLRPNAVDSLTGRNTGDNLGPGTPVVHIRQWQRPETVVRLILKGGGCENKSAQYSLPCSLSELGRADRDLDGVRKCILDTVHRAQGQGCSVGILGVAIGGDRASGYDQAKRQLFRELGDANPHPELARLEQYVVRTANSLGIGTMGFGGAATLLGCKIDALSRLPASFFVSVAYQCWALRRLGVVLDTRTGEIARWLYREAPPTRRLARDGELPLTGREVHLRTPLSGEDVRGLRVGDVVLLDGIVHTGRDALHKRLMEHEAPVDLNGAALYHCGPVAVEEAERWSIRAAGPTTSIREEPYEADVIRRFGLRAVIGKGGMGPRTLEALSRYGAVYLNAIGGAAQFYADRIVEVAGVDHLELGVPEAMWHLRVKDFPAIVTMDAHGHSLHADVSASSARELARHAAPLAS